MVKLILQVRWQSFDNIKLKRIQTQATIYPCLALASSEEKLLSQKGNDPTGAVLQLISWHYTNETRKPA